MTAKCREGRRQEVGYILPDSDCLRVVVNDEKVYIGANGSKVHTY